MKINEETTVSEEQVLFNKLSYEEQQFILKQMRMLQPCELSCEIEEKKIPNKWEEPAIKGMKSSNSFEELVPYIETIMRTQNDILDYLKSKGE